jgi:DNA helicase-2/ATP-dependent DNA helicase PcrA
LIQQQKVDPKSILVLTFTRAAAKELRERIARESGLVASPVQVSTLHSFALKTLLDSTARSGLTTPIRIADDWEEQNIIREDLKTIMGLKGVKDAEKKLHELSADWETLDAEKQDHRSPDPRFLGALREHKGVFGYTLRSELVYKLKHALDEGGVQPAQFGKHILIDEYQDLNPCELAVAKALANGGAELYVAGDDDQSIYSFRFADPEGIRRFPDEYPGADELSLEECQRCGQRILDIAEYVAELDPRRAQKNLRSACQPQQEEVHILRFSQQFTEADGIAQICRWLVNQKGLNPESILVLMRSDYNRAFSKPIKNALDECGVHVAVVANPLQPLDKKEGRAFLALLRLAANRQDHLAWRTLLQLQTNNIGEGKLEQIYGRARNQGERFAQSLNGIAKDPNSFQSWGRQIAAEVDTVNELTDELETAIKSKGLAKALNELAGRTVSDSALCEELQQLLDRLTKAMPASNLSELLRGMESSLGNDEQEREEHALNIMTMHQAKGLTATAVIIAGAEDERIPGLAKGKAVDDERRLLYVSLTRASQYLFVTHCLERIGEQMRAGSNRDVPGRTLSRFLSEGPLKSEEGQQYVSTLR